MSFNRKGWRIVDIDGTGMLEIQKDDRVGLLPDNAAAVTAAVMDGIKLIPPEDLPANFEFRYHGWLDTPENRVAIRDYCRKKVRANRTKKERTQ